MKKIKTISVQVLYEVEYDNLKVPKNVYNGLKKIEKANYYSITYKDYGITGDEEKIAAYWLTQNVSEADAHSLEYEVDVTEN